MEFEFKTPQPFRLFRDGLDIFLKDDLLRGGRTDDLTEPAQVSWAPGRLPRITDIVAQQKGFEPILGRLEIAQGIFSGTAQVTDGFSLHPGDVDRGSGPICARIRMSSP